MGMVRTASWGDKERGGEGHSCQGCGSAPRSRHGPGSPSGPSLLGHGALGCECCRWC